MLLRVITEPFIFITTFVETIRRQRLTKCTVIVYAVAAVHVVIAHNDEQKSTTTERARRAGKSICDETQYNKKLP